MSPDFFSWVKQQEASFETDEIRVGDNWRWNFRKHVQLIFHLKNGVFFTGENDWMRAFKNIMEPILNLNYWSEDIEVKDIVFYIEEKADRVLSFLVKKYHDEVFVKENNLDTLFDEITESDLDYGGVLVQKTTEPRPEVFELNTVAFCDQTDILGGPIAFKHYFSPDKLRGMSSFGWGKDSNGATISIEDLILLAQPSKDAPSLGSTKNKIPSKTIEVYIVRGNLPEQYLEDNDNMEDFYNQVQICAFYEDEDNNKNGVFLYRKKEDEGNFKFHTSKKVYGRALGRGVGESVLPSQIWTNFLEIHKMKMLEAGSKVPLYTDDDSYTQKNRIQDMENLEITTIQDGKRIFQVPTVAPANIQLFEKEVNTWYEHAQLSGQAFDPLLGKQAVSGTTFRGQNQVVQLGKGGHDRRRGQRAKFIEEIYRDWIIPDITKQLIKGKKFMANLTTEEMKWVTDQLASKYAFDEQKSDVLNGKEVRDFETLKQLCIGQFVKKGNKHLFEILKGEFEDVSIKIGINVAGKQKDLAGLNDKILSILQSAIAAPQNFIAAMQIPGMSQSFNDILEYSGISQVDFAAVMHNQQQMQSQQGQATGQPQLPQPVAA